MEAKGEEEDIIASATELLNDDKPNSEEAEKPTTEQKEEKSTEKQQEELTVGSKDKDKPEYETTGKDSERELLDKPTPEEKGTEDKPSEGPKEKQTKDNKVYPIMDSEDEKDLESIEKSLEVPVIPEEDESMYTTDCPENQEKLLHKSWEQICAQAESPVNVVMDPDENGKPREGSDKPGFTENKEIINKMTAWWKTFTEEKPFAHLDFVEVYMEKDNRKYWINRHRLVDNNKFLDDNYKKFNTQIIMKFNQLDSVIEATENYYEGDDEYVAFPFEKWDQNAKQERVAHKQEQEQNYELRLFQGFYIKCYIQSCEPIRY